MGSPRVLLLGVPNAGKSTLFNRLAGRRRALVHARPGMTRDRIETAANLAGRDVQLVDTGGVSEGDSGEQINHDVSRQSLAGLVDADLVLLVCDGRRGLTAGDRWLAGEVRKSGLPVILVVNKIDLPALEPAAAEFHALGLDPLLMVSAEHAEGLGDLETAAAALLPDRGRGVDPEDEVRLALVGRPNVGKSSLLNRILNQDRSLVSPEPGTTRDAVDTVFHAFGRTIRLVDTAGLRRRKSAAAPPESLAMEQARRALRRCHVAFLVMDAGAGITTGDLAVAGLARDAGRAVVPVLNKWDLAPEGHEARQVLLEDAGGRLRFLPHARILGVSAATGLRVSRLLPEALLAHRDFSTSLPTSEWNRLLRLAVDERRPPVVDGRALRFFYAVQKGSGPPSLEIFVNTHRAVPEAYRRFLAGRLRLGAGLVRTTLRLGFRPRRAARDGSA